MRAEDAGGLHQTDRPSGRRRLIRLFRPEDVRASYDAVAERYAQEIATELSYKPFDRDFLDRYADTYRRAAEAGFDGPVVELGSGPGHVAAYLADRGLAMSGIDLSPAMVEQARRLYPHLQFDVGDMLDLPYESHSVAGLVAFYSIIHFSDEQLIRAFREMERVLRRWGVVAIAFHVGDELVHRDEWWGTPVCIDARSLEPKHVTHLLRQAGIVDVISVTEREPYAAGIEYQSRRAYIVAGPLPPFELGQARTELRRRLVDAVLRGEKTATAGLASDHAPYTDEPLPEPFERWALVDFDDRLVAIVETGEVRVVPARDVDLQFARDEGEGFESVADWRAAHERFWHNQDITDDTEIVAERFRVVEVF
ncbi:MAG: methyltransferase domain-containing protein [Candidatus Limnocylindrales bacterium]